MWNLVKTKIIFLSTDFYYLCSIHDNTNINPLSSHFTTTKLVSFIISKVHFRMDKLNPSGGILNTAMKQTPKTENNPSFLCFIILEYAWYNFCVKIG